MCACSAVYVHLSGGYSVVVWFPSDGVSDHYYPPLCTEFEANTLQLVCVVGPVHVC